MIEAIKPRGDNRVVAGVVAVECVVFLMYFLKLVLCYKPIESSDSSLGVVEVVRGSIDRVFSVIEVTHEDSVVRVIVVS
jgi:hypothetical protein